MKQVSDTVIKKTLTKENPWWELGLNWHSEHKTTRTFFTSFLSLVKDTAINRALVLYGPRRTGKSVMMKQVITTLIHKGFPAKRILFASLDNPVHLGAWLESFLPFLEDVQDTKHIQIIDKKYHSHYVFFDEIQHLDDWQRHLKVLVDTYPTIKFVVSGSAAAALKHHSIESGAGRFRDFLLPPLTFFEYLDFIDKTPTIEDRKAGKHNLNLTSDQLNAEFIDYINYGGFPEVALAKKAGVTDLDSIIGKDVLDKVLLLDLPSIYGIDDSRELYRFFAKLALNTGMELSIKELAQSTNISENTIRKYLEFLEAAFLIQVIHRIDKDGRHFKRVWTFKVYLTNPSLRTALYGPITIDDDIGHIIETAVFGQFYRPTRINQLNYARWKDGEVDMIWRSKPEPAAADYAIEIKWSDRIRYDVKQVRALVQFSAKTKPNQTLLLTKSINEERKINDLVINVFPVALFCYAVSRYEYAALLIGPALSPQFAKQLIVADFQ